MLSEDYFQLIFFWFLHDSSFIVKKYRAFLCALQLGLDNNHSGLVVRIS